MAKKIKTSNSRASYLNTILKSAKQDQSDL